MSVGVGVIGLGAHAVRSHIDHLPAVDGAHLAAVCDTNADVLNAFSAGPGVRPHINPMTLIDDPHVQAVIVCTPDRFHADLLVACVQAGKHCLVEKPLADETGDLEAIREALTLADEREIVVTSCHPRRTDPPYLLLADIHTDALRRFGAAMHVHLDFFYHEPSKQGLHKGLLLDHANHEIDLLQFLLGPCAFTAHKLTDSETRYAAAGVRDDGVTFTFHGARTLKARKYGELVRIRYSTGEIELDLDSGQVSRHNFDTGSREHATAPTTDYTRRFVDLNQNFVDTILGREAGYLTAREMLVNTEIGIALTDHGVYRHDG